MNQDWSKISQFSEPEHSPGFLLWQVSSLWRRKIETALYPLGITHVQFVLLANEAVTEGTCRRGAARSPGEKIQEMMEREEPG